MVAAYSAEIYPSSRAEWDGILGLSPTPAFGSDSFVQMLKQQKIIDTASFGVYYDDTVDGSEITFGGINTDIVSSLSKFTFTDLYDPDYWSVNITSMKYGDTQFNMQARCGIIDTGKSIIMLPSEDYIGYVKEAQKDNVCYSTGPILRCE